MDSITWNDTGWGPPIEEFESTEDQFDHTFNDYLGKKRHNIIQMTNSKAS